MAAAVPHDGGKEVIASLGQDRFVSAPARIIVVPVTVKVGSSFDGRVALAAPEPSDLAGTVQYWISGRHTTCNKKAADKEPSLPLAVSYTHGHGITKNHNLMMSIPADAAEGTYRCEVRVFVGETVRHLPFTIQVRKPATFEHSSD